MRVLAALICSTLLLASFARADSLMPAQLISWGVNPLGQATARMGIEPTPFAPASFFDVFVDIQDRNGNSVCTTAMPCFHPPDPGGPVGGVDPQPFLDSRQFRQSEFVGSFFDVFFRVVPVPDDGHPGGIPVPNDGLPVLAAGLNQAQNSTHSFFDVFFEVGLGSNSALGLLGFDVFAPIPDDGQPVPDDNHVTGPGAIAWHSANSFLLDPQDFAPIFQIQIGPGPLINAPPPQLVTNPVPEPSTLLLVGTGVAALLRRRFGRKA